MKIPHHERGGRRDAIRLVQQERKEEDPNPVDVIRSWIDRHWNKILSEYRNHDLIAERHLREHLETAMYLSLLFPDRKNQLQIDEALWNAAMPVIHRGTGWPHDAALLAVLFPDRRTELPLNKETMNPDSCSLVFDFLPAHYVSKHWQLTGGLESAVDYLILFPEHRNRVGLPALEQKVRRNPYMINEWESLQDIAHLRLLLPQCDFSQAAYRWFKKYQSEPENVDEHFSQHLNATATKKFASLAILVADHVALDGKGIQIQMNQSTQEGVVPLPDRSIV